MRGRVRLCDRYSELFGVEVGVHQGSALSPLLFSIMLAALSREFRTGCPWELLYADDWYLVQGGTAGKGEDTWKSVMEEKGICVNTGRTRKTINLELMKECRKDTCGVCQTGVGCNTILLGC